MLIENIGKTDFISKNKNRLVYAQNSRVHEPLVLHRGDDLPDIVNDRVLLHDVKGNVIETPQHVNVLEVRACNRCQSALGSVHWSDHDPFISHFVISDVIQES